MRYHACKQEVAATKLALLYSTSSSVLLVQSTAALELALLSPHSCPYPFVIEYRVTSPDRSGALAALTSSFLALSGHTPTPDTYCCRESFYVLPWITAAGYGLDLLVSIACIRNS
jgi:hypothetical protein